MMHCVLSTFFMVLLVSHTSGRLPDYHVFGANDNRVNQENRCRNLGYDGLAVLNTPEKWARAFKILPRNVAGVYLGLDYQKDSASCFWHDGTPLRSDVPIGPFANHKPSATRSAGRMTTTSQVLMFSEAWRTKSALCGNYQEKPPSVRESWGKPVQGQLNTVNPTILSVTESTYSFPECALMCGMEAECRAAEFNSDLRTCTLIGEYTSGGPDIATVNIKTYVRQKY